MKKVGNQTPKVGKYVITQGKSTFFPQKKMQSSTLNAYSMELNCPENLGNQTPPKVFNVHIFHLLPSFPW